MQRWSLESVRCCNLAQGRCMLIGGVVALKWCFIMHAYLLWIYKQIVDAFLKWLTKMSLRNNCCRYLIMWLILVVKLVINQLANDIFILKSNWLELDISRPLMISLIRGGIQWTVEVLKKCNTLLNTFKRVFRVTTITIYLISYLRCHPSFENTIPRK